MNHPLAPPRTETAGVAAILVARSAVAATPLAEMSALAETIGALPGIAKAAFAFTEQGTPSLRDALLTLRERGFGEIVLVPLLLPMEPSFPSWLAKVIGGWRKAFPGDWPTIRVAPVPMETRGLAAMAGEMVAGGLLAEPIEPISKAVPEGSIVPDQEHRVFVCMGGPCNVAGGSAIWSHFRNEQVRLDLRNQCGGTMSAKASCLGPCNLAPVVQVFPDSTYYGGVDEAGVDRIISEHLLGGRIVADLAYPADGKKQRLRAPAKTLVET